MLDIFVLRDMAMNVAQGLKATREGNTSALEQAIAAAQKGLTGLQTAASTRQTIQQTQQSQQLFPGVVTQQKQATKLGDIKVEEAEMTLDQFRNLVTALKATPGGENLDYTALLDQLKAKRGVAVQQVRGTPESIATEAGAIESEVALRGEVAETQRGLEEGRGITEQEQQLAKQAEAKLATDTANFKRFYNLPEISARVVAETLPKEYALKIQQLEIAQLQELRLLKGVELATKKVELAEEKFELLREGWRAAGLTDSTAMYLEWAMKSGIVLDEEAFQRQETLLTQTLANILTMPTIREAVQAASAAAGIPELKAMDFFRTGGVQTDRPITTETQKVEAAALIRTLRNDLVIDRNKLPFGRKRRLLTTPGVSADESIEQQIDGIMGK